MMTQDEWDQTEREIVRAWTGGELTQALSQIDAVLDRGSDEQRSRALLYRGSICEDAGNWEAAKKDFVQAVDLLPAASYVRYTAELSVGQVCARASDVQEALTWYRAALKTCATAVEPFSGAAATKAILALQPLPAADLELAKIVTARSWRVLNLPNEPDLEDLARTAEMLMERAAKPDA